MACRHANRREIYEKSNGVETSASEFNAIESAIRGWATISGSSSGCSNVSIGLAVRTNRVWRGLSELPEVNEILVVRTLDRPGQFQDVTTAAGMYGGWVWLNDNYNEVYIPPNQGPLYRVDNLARHEFGHSFGVYDGLASDPPSVMAANSFDSNQTLQITACDIDGHRRVYCPGMPTPTPTPNPTPPPSQCAFPPNFILYPSTGCAIGRQLDYSTGCCTCNRSAAFIAGCFINGGDYDPDLCGCTGVCYEGGSCSPIVVDVLGNGFSLTNPSNGVSFDLGAPGTTWQSAWTSIGSDDAWLALDRNHNGVIDNGKELFGNITVQDTHPTAVERNGFLALAEYDKIMNGGNNDGKINHNDAIFDRLKLWQDSNHDGVSESCELFSLPQLGLRRIDLDYRASERVDAHGNQFKYRSRVYDNDNAQLGRWAWDVFLVVQQP